MNIEYVVVVVVQVRGHNCHLPRCLRMIYTPAPQLLHVVLSQAQTGCQMHRKNWHETAWGTFAMQLLSAMVVELVMRSVV